MSKKDEGSSGPLRRVVYTSKGKPSFENPGDMVTLYSKSKNSTAFKVHRDFACHYSPVLHAAFHSNFMEGQTQEYVLKDTDEEAIKQLVNWIYTRNLKLPPVKLDETYENVKANRIEEFRLARLWVLADFLLIPKLQNLVISVLNQRMVEIRGNIGIECLPWIYRATSSGSPLRRLYIHQCALVITPTIFSTELFSKQMMVDIATLSSAYVRERVRLNYYPNGHVMRNMEDFLVPEEGEEEEDDDDVDDWVVEEQVDKAAKKSLFRSRSKRLFSRLFR